MLPSVLTNKKAVDTSIRIIDAFVAMRRFIIQNANILMRIAAVFPTGCIWDAWTYVSDLVRSAKRSIILIDNFVDDRVLTMLAPATSSRQIPDH